MKKWVIGGLVLCLATFVVVKYWWLFYLFIVPPYRGPQFETWNTENHNFQVRVEAFHEANGGFVPGAYYTFLSARISSDQWEEIMTFRHDDPIPIRTNQVHFVNDDVAFVFMGWKFAATTDTGRHWTVWDGCEKAKPLKICNYEGIKAVELSADGTGAMTVNPIPDQSPLPVLRTEDFGRSWRQ
jgi:hypothetical protein